MKALNICQFEEEIRKNPPKDVGFFSSNIVGGNCSDVQFALHFPNIKITANPNIVMLYTDDAHVSIRGVKRCFYEKSDILGKLYTLVCGESSREVRYTLVCN